MKRIFCLLLAVCMMASLCACGKDSEKDAGNDTPSSDVEVSAPTESIPTPKEQETPGKSKPSQPAAGKVDVGMEFVLEGDLTYPDDYPELGTEITVIGEFQSYEENGMTRYHLVNARLA